MSLDEKPESRPASATPPSIDGELLAQDVRLLAERRLVRTLDMRLLPTIVVIVIMNYIDVRAMCDLDPSVG